MNDSLEQPENETLIQGYAEGSLTEEESARLHTLLQRDPSKVDVILAALRDESLIRIVVAETAASTEASSQGNSSWAALLRRLCFIFTQPQYRFRPLAGLGLAACTLVFVGLGFWWFGPTMGEPVLAEAPSAGLSLERAGQPFPPTVGLRLKSGDILRTTEKATATIAFGPEKTRISLEAGTELRLGALSQGKRLALGGGKLEAWVARQRPFRPMVITTPQAEARVLGTSFALTVTTNATRLEVSEGKIRFIRAQDGAKVNVGAGCYAVAAANYELLAQPLTGSILREYWTNISGTGNFTLLLRSPDYPDHPSGGSYLKNFEAPSHWGQNYGARITGYLHPPVTGEYTFWIESSGLCELFLSPSEDPENRRQIAYAEATSPREWTKNPAQQTSAITLIAGRRYYIEVLQKQGQGDDHLAVAWQGPGRNREIVPGEFLSPFEPKKEKAHKP
ncbi:MAG: FecR domain-containing protein [Limisphaerales bacterium]